MRLAHNLTTNVAGSTQISVTVNDGGLKLLQIKDNGAGIHPDDLPILCHRHTTSKIEKYEDLASVTTLGFRGEALCSISFVSRLTITTMQPSAEMGYKAEYRDSKMVTPEPEPCAAVQGTCIQVEDLFYNVPTRKKAMKSASEEFKRIFDMVAKYATYCTGAAFMLNTLLYTASQLVTLPPGATSRARLALSRLRSLALQLSNEMHFECNPNAMVPQCVSTRHHLVSRKTRL